MTIAQTKRFYNSDNKAYELDKNNNFIKWLNDKKSSGYQCFISIESLQHLIDFIVIWYEIKYTDRDFDEYDDEFETLECIAETLNFNQLLYRLKQKSLNLIKCEYMARCGTTRPVQDDHGKVVAYEPALVLKITKKGEIDTDFANYYKVENQPEFFVYANSKTGKVRLDYYLEHYVSTSNNVITLEGLLKIFEKTQQDNLDYTELEECINNHKTDLELRKIILQLAALKILYSSNTIPEYGYERAKKFITEFNEGIPNLNLSFEEIDSIMKRDYTTDSKENNNIQNKQKIKKRLFKKNK